MASNLDLLAPKNIEKQILIKICNENTEECTVTYVFKAKCSLNITPIPKKGQNINGHSTKTKANEVIFSNIFSVVAF